MAETYCNIGQVVETAVERSPDKVYLVCGDEQITYRQLDRHINRAANGFLRLGLRKGDRVALMLPNRPEFLYAWLGLNKIGTSMVPINTAFKSREARYVIDHSESRLLLADARYMKTLRLILEECPRLEGTIILDEPAPWDPPAGTAGAPPAPAGRSGRGARGPSPFLTYSELV